MKHHFLIAILLICVNASAQNKINLNGLAALDAIENKAKVQGISTPSQRIEAVVLMNPGWNHETFTKYDAEIITEVSDEILVVGIPAANILAFSENQDVKYVEFGNTYTAAMDYARPAAEVNSVQEGFSFDDRTLSFDGTGVVTGLMDVGLDPNHPMFLTSDDQPRVKQVYDYGNNVAAVTPEQVKAFTTDDAAQTHGTHVAGIMAGKAYNDRGRYCVLPTPTGGSMIQRMGQIPFYGIATGSDIVMTAGSFNEANIIKGASAVANYAQEQGKPFVLNLSMAKSDGPHDGSGAVEQALALLGKKGVVCLASGNNGAQTTFVGKEFTSADKSVATFVSGNLFSGIDIWSNNEQPLSVAVSLYNNGELTKLCEISSPNQTVYPSTPFYDNVNGNFAMRSEVNTLNNRFHVQMAGNFWPKNEAVRIVLTVSGNEGQTLYCYGCGTLPTQFTSYGIQGYTDGSTDGTISNMATAENTIAVGAFNSSCAWGAFNGYTYNLTPITNYPIGQVSFYSAYGSTFQATTLPRVCAPGTAIKSSLNRYFTANESEEELNKHCARIDKNVDMKAYWGHQTGTSMASPFVAGTIALWLQADPTLSTDDILSIIDATSDKPADCSTEDNLRWGAGKINALAGIKEVLTRKASGLTGVIADSDIVITQGERQLSISAAASTSIQAHLYNLQGIITASAYAEDSELTLNAANLPAGIYILLIQPSNSAPVSRRILLR